MLQAALIRDRVGPGRLLGLLGFGGEEVADRADPTRDGGIAVVAVSGTTLDVERFLEFFDASGRCLLDILDVDQLDESHGGEGGEVVRQRGWAYRTS